jgi:hypothetical protein
LPAYLHIPRHGEAVCGRHVQAEDRHQPRREHDGRPGLRRARAVCGARPAAAGGPDGRGVVLLPTAFDGDQGSSAAAELGGGAPRAAPARDKAAAVVGGASRRLSGRLWLQPFPRAPLRPGNDRSSHGPASRHPARRRRTVGSSGDPRSTPPGRGGVRQSVPLLQQQRLEHRHRRVARRPIPATATALSSTSRSSRQADRALRSGPSLRPDYPPSSIAQATVPPSARSPTHLLNRTTSPYL